MTSMRGMTGIAPRAAIIRAPLRLPYQQGILYHNIKRFLLGSGRDAVHEKEDSLARLERIAFMSYAHENNRDKYLSKLRERLEAAVSDRMGTPFTIFQDLVHIHAGHKWEDRVKLYLSRSTLLLPVITPHFYNSEWCREEFMYFRDKEQQTNRGPRILPMYYIGCPQMGDSSEFQFDSMEVLLRRYQYADLCELYENATDINSPPAKRTLRKMAKRIQEMLEELEANSDDSGPPTSPGGGPEPPGGGPASPHRGQPYPSDFPMESQLPADRYGDWRRLRDTRIDAPPARSAFKEVANRIVDIFNVPLGDRVSPFDLTILPHPRAFFGRGSDLDWVIEMLTTAPLPHVAALDGAQGIGKTAVAAEAVLRLYADAQFPGGIAVVLCTGMTDPHDVLRRALIRFDPERRPPAQDDEAGLAEEALHLLSAKQTLIVLDDIEPRLDITRVIEPLSRAGAALLLTSKRPLPVAKARRRTLAPLQMADALDLLTTPSERRRPPNADHQ